MHRQTNRTDKRSLNRITYEKFDNNGDHFKLFTIQFFLCLRSIPMIRRSTLFFHKSIPSFRLMQDYFADYFVSTEKLVVTYDVLAAIARH